MPLQKQFRGVSDLIGRYQGGQLTFELLQQITPQFDVLQYMEPPRYAVALHNVGSAGAYHGPFLAPTSVPDDQLWVISALSAMSTGGLAAGQSLVMQPVINLPSVTERLCLGGDRSSALSTVGGPNLYADGIVFETPLVLEPGFQPGFIVTTWSGTGNVPTQVGMRYQIINI